MSSTTSTSSRSRPWLLAVMAAALLLSACGGGGADGAAKAPGAAAPTAGPSGSSSRFASDEVLTITAIPDQDPQDLQRRYSAVSDYLAGKLGVKVTYKPVVDYTASVTSFRRGDVDAAFFGGLSGVQARLQTPGSVLLAQRDIDEAFTSVFIASPDAGIKPFTDVAGLSALKGRSLTYGSEVSTSGRLMPQFFVGEAGVESPDLKGDPGFSGSHDKTIALVEAGTFQVGALNSSVWDKRVQEGKVDPSKAVEIFRTPAYHDYHWLAGGKLDEKFGAGFTEALKAALLDLDGSDQSEKDILGLFSAGSFIPTTVDNYDDIEAVARKLKLIT